VVVFHRRKLSSDCAQARSQAKCASESCYGFVPIRSVFSLKTVFADNRAARELVCGIGSMQRLRMTLHDSLRICDACKKDKGLQAKAKMILFASKLDCAFREWLNCRLEFSTLC
jgi:hypothetical protein